MAQVIFKKEFDYRPSGDWRSIVEYKPSEEPQTVKRECAEQAIKAGAATEHFPKGEGDAKRNSKTKSKD